MRGTDTGRYQALAASVLLHAGLALTAWYFLSRFDKPLHFSDVVPVTLMTSADVAQMRQAVAAPTPAPASAENPVPQAPPTPAAPVETPAPTPAPTPKSDAASAKAAPKPPAKQDARAKPPAELNLDALAKSLAQPSKQKGSPRLSGPPGPNQAATSRTPSSAPGNGSTVSADALASMKAILGPLWNPACETRGAAGIVTELKIRLDSGRRLVSIESGGRMIGMGGDVDTNSDSRNIALYRAVHAVRQADNEGRFSAQPAGVYDLIFDPKAQCAER